MPEELPSAPVMLRSRKEPASTATLPVTVQDAYVATRQLSVVLDMLPGVPWRSVTVTGFACREKTARLVAVQAVGTQVSAEGSSARLALVLLSE